MAALRSSSHGCIRSLSYSTRALKPHGSRAANESLMANAKHKPSLSGPSLGHLISELSATTPQMLRDGLRVEGQTMSEADRTLARRITLALVAVPLGVGAVLFAAGKRQDV